jgi:hypothetical protein
VDAFLFLGLRFFLPLFFFLLGGLHCFFLVRNVIINLQVSISYRRSVCDV